MLIEAASRIDVLDLAGRVIANPRRAAVGTAGELALAFATEKFWAVAIEADLLTRALSIEITGDEHEDAAREAAIQHQAAEVSRLMAAIRGEANSITNEEENDGSRNS